MINLRNIEYIIYLITFIIAYLIAETLSGWFRAYIAKKMGDDTPEALGYLTLNPLVHIDPVGIIFIALYGFGWGRAAPITPDNINDPHKYLKLTCAYFSDTFAHFILALSSLLMLVTIFGIKIIDIAEPMLYYKNISLPYLTHFYPHYASSVLTIAIILVALMYLCVILAVLNFIVNGFRLIMFLFFHESLGNWYIDLIVPIILIIVYASSLQEYVIKGITYLAKTLAYFI